jgi:hypothetical protein
MNQYKIEKYSQVKAAILTTLGELKSTKYSSELKEISNNLNDYQMAIRAKLSLITIFVDSMNLDERKESAQRICELITKMTSPSMSEERKLVAIGLKYLKIEDEIIVFETLLKLLQDDNSSVKLEAGKTLTTLKFQ